MSAIRIYVDPSTSLSQLAQIVRPIAGTSISELKHHVVDQNPIYEVELFLNNFANVADDLRSLVKGLKHCDIDFTIFEMEDEITPETLFNILEGSENYRL